MAEIFIDDTDAFCLVPLFEDYGLSLLRGILQLHSVVMVIFPMIV